MTSRRIVSNEQTSFKKDNGGPTVSIRTENSSVAPAVPAAVIYKLLGFTLAMVAGPIMTYYLTLNTIFRALRGREQQQLLWQTWSSWRM